VASGPSPSSLVLATANPDKAAEMAALLAGLGLKLLTRADFADLPEVEETADDFAGNALLKAEALCRATGLPALGDDSGLCVDALDGAPGVLSARYAGPGCTYADNNRKLLEALAGVPEAARGARFVCVAAVARPGTEAVTFEGVCPGRIAQAERGGRGFGYDPLFVPALPDDASGRTFAEMDPAEKARVSHRARAFALAREWLAQHLAEGA
jgi:XTP/dITP diphosphohydrolase